MFKVSFFATKVAKNAAATASSLPVLLSAQWIFILLYIRDFY
jgi:hypothetical protein